MAQREREKVKRVPARTKETAQGYSEALQRLESRARALERERDAIKAELETARARIAALEESRGQVANRIDWIIDSLNGLMDKNA